MYLSTGMRRGEELGLRWQDIVFDQGTASIRQTITVIGAQAINHDSPKTKAGRRAVLMPTDTIAILRQHKALKNAHRLSIGPLWEDHDLVFPNLYGRPLHPRNLSRTYYAILKASGVPELRIHDKRHTHASWLLLAGQPIHTVSERLGHAKASITLDLRAHTLKNSQAEPAIAGKLLTTEDRKQGVF